MQSVATSERESACPGRSVMWDALRAASEIPVLVVAADGTIQEANDCAHAVFGTAGSSTRLATDQLPQAVATELLSFIHRVSETHVAVAVDAVIRGRWLRLTLRPYESDGQPAVLIVGSLGHEGTPSEDLAHATLKNQDGGEMAGLTPREVEILRLIALGLSTNEIARVLFRSVKTIEGHRVSLGSKLNVTNRVELARVALRTGLITLDTPIPEIVDEPE